ncbi:MAG TPA: hypothetical protein VIL58_05585 [Thermoplasmata archaeon]|nr:hypothetical protein [Thermoplasmata archaeon]
MFGRQTKVRLDLAGMGMGLLRWLLWPRRGRDMEDDEPRRRRSRGKPARKVHHPGVYRIEVDNEASRFHGDAPPFSFWSSSRVILILSLLLWWIQPAGPMIAGFVGGRRAGSPMKAVVAALLPVIAIYVANVSYAHNVAARQIDFVASLPMVVSDALASILPFLLPYKEFLVSYMTGFVQALTTTFGMGTNGYLMVIIFAYIGGLIAEQTRRELTFRSGSGSSVGVNLLQPLIGGRPFVDQEEEADEEDEEIHRSRRPVRARARGHPALISTGRGRRHRGRGEEFESYRKVSADADDTPRHRPVHVRHSGEEDEADEDDEEERIVTRTHRVPRGRPEDDRDHGRLHHRREAEEEQEPEAREEPSARPVRTRSQAEERAIQRFVERALKNYDHSKL